MVKGKKLVFDASIVFFLGLLSSIMGYLIKVTLSRQLTLEEFGLFYSVFTFVNFFIVFKDFGIGQSLTKLIPEFLARKEYGKVKYSIKFVFFINLVMGLIFTTIFILISKFLTQNYFKNELAKPLLIILSLYFVLYSFYIIFIHIFVGFQKSILYSQNLFLINLFVFIGLFIFKKFGVISPAVSYLFASIIGVIFGIVALSMIFSFRHVSSTSKNVRSKLFDYGFPLLVSSIGFVFIAQIDTLLLTKFRSLAEIGIYNVVLPTSMLLITFGSSLALVMLPMISESWVKKEFKILSEIINKIYKYAFILTIPFALVVFVFSELILKVLFGVGFISGGVALKILAIGATLFSVAAINNNITVAIGKPRQVTKIILLAAALNFVLNLLLIPSYGIIGAALATSFAYLVVLVLSTYNVSKFVKVKIPLFDWFKTFIVAVIFIFIISFLKYIIVLDVLPETLLVLFLSGVVYFILLNLFGLLNFKEVSSMLRNNFSLNLDRTKNKLVIGD